ncbi:hypothetical protein BDV97DRAFT_41000 [Delphinella strobiligena]|nr:hypothetical protein BDV97DRAFT_41000 [Delphinella strobiligena]
MRRYPIIQAPTLFPEDGMELWLIWKTSIDVVCGTVPLDRYPSISDVGPCISMLMRSDVSIPACGCMVFQMKLLPADASARSMPPTVFKTISFEILVGVVDTASEVPTTAQHGGHHLKGNHAGHLPVYSDGIFSWVKTAEQNQPSHIAAGRHCCSINDASDSCFSTIPV